MEKSVYTSMELQNFHLDCCIKYSGLASEVCSESSILRPCWDLAVPVRHLQNQQPIIFIRQQNDILLG